MKPGKDWLKEWWLGKDYYTDDSFNHTVEGKEDGERLMQEGKETKKENNNEQQNDTSK